MEHYTLKEESLSSKENRKQIKPTITTKITAWLLIALAVIFLALDGWLIIDSSPLFGEGLWIVIMGPVLVVISLVLIAISIFCITKGISLLRGKEQVQLWSWKRGIICIFIILLGILAIRIVVNWYG